MFRYMAVATERRTLAKKPSGEIVEIEVTGFHANTDQTKENLSKKLGGYEVMLGTSSLLFFAPILIAFIAKIEIPNFSASIEQNGAFLVALAASFFSASHFNRKVDEYENKLEQLRDTQSLATFSDPKNSR
jgi:hypothetical protein